MMKRSEESVQRLSSGASTGQSTCVEIALENVRFNR